MTDSVSADTVVAAIDQARQLYHRLVLVVAPSGSGKTSALAEVARRTDSPVANVNLELAKRMLELTGPQRALQAARLMDEIVSSAGAETVLLDNTEILFDPQLQQDPLRLLQGLARNRTIVASWNGRSEGGCLIYAEPGHPEHRREAAKDCVVVGPNASAGVAG
jgi:hypothetical protein